MPCPVTRRPASGGSPNLRRTRSGATTPRGESWLAALPAPTAVPGWERVAGHGADPATVSPVVLRPAVGGPVPVSPVAGGRADVAARSRSCPAPRRDERDPQPLERLLSRLVAEHGWAADVAVHGLFSRWDTLVGGDVARHCRPEQFVDGHLVVRVDSTAWATQMRLLRPLVLQRLHDEIGTGTVDRIDVRGPHAPSWRHGRFAVRGARGPRDTYG